MSTNTPSHAALAPTLLKKVLTDLMYTIFTEEGSRFADELVEDWRAQQAGVIESALTGDGLTSLIASSEMTV